MRAVAAASLALVRRSPTWRIRPGGIESATLAVQRREIARAGWRHVTRTPRRVAYATIDAERRVLTSRAMHRDNAPIDARSLPHRNEPRTLHFPWEESVPESVIHLILRTYLYQLLRYVLSGRAFVGADQFLYFDGSDPKRNLAPDVYVVWGDRDGTEIKSWKTWERGTPALCIEIDNSAATQLRRASRPRPAPIAIRCESRRAVDDRLHSRAIDDAPRCRRPRCRRARRCAPVMPARDRRAHARARDARRCARRG